MRARSKHRWLRIPAPIGYIGDTVEVLNYKMRPPAWETGEICDVEFSPAQEIKNHDGSSFTVESSWTYRVWIHRPRVVNKYGNGSGGGYAVTVGDDGVRAVE